VSCVYAAGVHLMPFIDRLARPPVRLDDAPEVLDRPVDDPQRLGGALDDLARINRWLGGVALSRSALVRLMTGRHGGPGRGPLHGRRLRLLDVGTGGGELPAALLDWARGHGIDLRIEAIDDRPETIALARERQRDREGLSLKVADARALPYRDASFDVAHSSLFAHHFDPPELRIVLSELRRVSRRAVVVNDLHRARRWQVLARFLTPLVTRNPITRHDAPLSALRAYRPEELAQLCGQVGLVEAARIRGFLGHRYAQLFVPVPLPDEPARPSVANGQS
jgi:SAM-dependent methyltransferase